MTALAKLQWQCRRGTKELDLILQKFLLEGYGQINADEKILFAELLNFEDDKLSAYLIEKAPSVPKNLASLIHKIRPIEIAENLN
ncbi:MAG: succinate dehydrogenase assembly factor 2 [Methylococcales bacterium]